MSALQNTQRLDFLQGPAFFCNFAKFFTLHVSPLLLHIAAILLLEDGTVHHGKAFGKIGTTSGEICFNTGMTGYQEVFTDPSYYGQVLIMNSVHIGNYGVKDSDVESSRVQDPGTDRPKPGRAVFPNQAKGIAGRISEGQQDRLYRRSGYPGAGSACPCERCDELHHLFRDHRS